MCLLSVVVLKSVLYGSYAVYVLCVYLFIIRAMNFVYPCSINCYELTIHVIGLYDFISYHFGIWMDSTWLFVAIVAAHVLVLFMNFLVVPIRLFLSAFIVWMYSWSLMYSIRFCCVMRTVVICDSIS